MTKMESLSSGNPKASRNCAKCGSTGPFPRSKQSKDGWASYCVVCKNQVDRESYRRHREERVKSGAEKETAFRLM